MERPQNINSMMEASAQRSQYSNVQAIAIDRSREMNVRKKQRPYATTVQMFHINIIWSNEGEKKTFSSEHIQLI